MVGAAFSVPVSVVVLVNFLRDIPNFVFPLVVTTSRSSRVLPLQLFSFETEFGVNVPDILAAVVLATVPMVVLFVFGYRFLVRGLAAGLGGGGALK